MKRIIMSFIFGIFLLSIHTISHAQSPPTPQQIQNKINEGNKLKETYEKTKQKFLEAKEKLNKDPKNKKLQKKFKEADRRKNEAADRKKR